MFFYFISFFQVEVADINTYTCRHMQQYMICVFGGGVMGGRGVTTNIMVYGSRFRKDALEERGIGLMGRRTGIVKRAVEESAGGGRGKTQSMGASLVHLVFCQHNTFESSSPGPTSNRVTHHRCLRALFERLPYEGSRDRPGTSYNTTLH